LVPEREEREKDRGGIKGETERSIRQKLPTREVIGDAGRLAKRRELCFYTNEISHHTAKKRGGWEQKRNKEQDYVKGGHRLTEERPNIGGERVEFIIRWNRKLNRRGGKERGKKGGLLDGTGKEGTMQKEDRENYCWKSTHLIDNDIEGTWRRETGVAVPSKFSTNRPCLSSYRARIRREDLSKRRTRYEVHGCALVEQTIVSTNIGSIRWALYRKNVGKDLTVLLCQFLAHSKRRLTHRRTVSRFQVTLGKKTGEKMTKSG